MEPIRMFHQFLETRPYERPRIRTSFTRHEQISIGDQVLRSLKLSLGTVLPAISIFLPRSFHKKIVYNYFSSNGYVMMKFGQWLASRPDIVSLHICDSLSQLHSDAPRHLFNETLEILNREKFDLKALEFQTMEPIGSGSIAQVYKLRRKPGSSLSSLLWNKMTLAFGITKFHEEQSEFALKVIHPNVKKEVFIDMQIMTNIGNILSIFTFFTCFDLQNQIAAFKREILKQINMNDERINMSLYRHLNKYDRDIVIPRPIKSTENLLLTEYVPGQSIKYMKKENNNKFQDEKNLHFSNQLCSLFFKSVFHDRFLHTDLHPGNMAFNNNKIIIYDFGLTKFLSHDEYTNFLNLIVAIFLQKSPDKVASLLVDRLISNFNVNLDEFKHQSAPSLHSIMKILKFKEGSSQTFREAIQEFFTVCNKNNVKFDHKYNNLFVSALCLDGIARHLDPHCTFYQPIWRYLMVYSPFPRVAYSYIREKIENIMQ